MATTKARRAYTEAEFGPDDFIMFGKESAGIPEEILVDHEEKCIRIPMLDEIRSLNLSNAVAIVLYEALRQNRFRGMQRTGDLHWLHWKGKREGGKDMEGKSTYIAPGAVVLGDVTLEEDVSIWYNAVVRGDRDFIRIGRGSNVQDNAVLHVNKDCPVVIGENVTIGHGAIVHGCTVGDNSMIGMGAILMNGSHIGKNCIIGAGALVTQGVTIPDNSLVLGTPGRVKRAVTKEELEINLLNARAYVEEARSELGR